VFRTPVSGEIIAILLAVRGSPRHASGMLVVSETDADMIRSAFRQGGELSAAIELRRLFPGIQDNQQARDCARAIAGWKPLVIPLKNPRACRPRTRSSTR
jgi:hypothetical protein